MIQQHWLQTIIAIAKEAGEVILTIYEQDFDVSYKADNSPLTQADLSANKLICSKLQQLTPDIPILSEENTEIPYVVRQQWEYFWCVDPIDGTKEFVNKNGEFTVNIALIHNQKPILGVIYAPALGTLYWAQEGGGAFRDGIKLPLAQAQTTCVILTSRSHQNEAARKYIQELQTQKPKEIRSVGSSLKFCMIAEGSADIYPKLSPTMEWDTAAAQIILTESGKNIFELSTMLPLSYNKTSLLNPHFIAF